MLCVCSIYLFSENLIAQTHVIDNGSSKQRIVTFSGTLNLSTLNCVHNPITIRIDSVYSNNSFARKILLDVIITGYNGAISNVGLQAGLQITNIDWCDLINPFNLEELPFYKQGSITIHLNRPAPSVAGWFYKLGGEYTVRLDRWVKAKAATPIDLSKTSIFNEVEGEPC